VIYEGGAIEYENGILKIMQVKKQENREQLFIETERQYFSREVNHMVLNFRSY
jgi:hypothetical protein